jgi:predicted SprT family Zn-dependent metalloprotease
MLQDAEFLQKLCITFSNDINNQVITCKLCSYIMKRMVKRMGGKEGEREWKWLTALISAKHRAKSPCSFLTKIYIIWTHMKHAI